jgi:hypothetical protein
MAFRKNKPANAALANSGQAWREEDYTLLLSEYLKGTSSDEIAVKLKRSTVSIEMQMCKKITEYIDDRNTLADLCKRYNFDLNVYKKYNDKSTDKSADKSVDKSADKPADKLNIEPINTENMILLLTEIRDLLIKIENNTKK